MNLNQITTGTDYAYFPYRGRGEEFRWSEADTSTWRTHTRYVVYRVKAIRAFSERETGKKRDTGYVDVFWLDDEGEFLFDENNQHQIKKVRVRDIATLWDDYEDERDYRQVQRDKEKRERDERRRIQEERYQREMAEREQIRLEREERERIERERIEQERKVYLSSIEQKYNLPEGSVKYNGGLALALDKSLIDADLLKLEQGRNNEIA
jgi:hypothetical protein